MPRRTSWLLNRLTFDIVTLLSFAKWLYYLSMKSLTLSFLLTITPCLTIADNPKEFLDCGLEAEITKRVVDSKIKGTPLTEIVSDWQKGEEEYTKDYIENLVTFAYRNYPVLTKLEIANLQLRKCLKAEGLLAERIWLPDT